MDVQPALRQTTFDVRQDLLRLRLRPTVRDDIIRVPLERNVRVRGPHPVVEREVQEDIGQERARDAANAKGNFQFDRVITGWRNRLVLDFRLKR